MMDDAQFTILQTGLCVEGRQRFNHGFQSVEAATRGGGCREADKEEQLHQGFNALCKDLFVPAESARGCQHLYMNYHLLMKEIPMGQFKRHPQKVEFADGFLPSIMTLIPRPWRGTWNI